MIQIGRFNIHTPLFGTFRLDGGAMFGSVPKNLWSKLIEVDDENCIPLAARGLLIEDGEKTFLVDTGCGTKWSEKRQTIFAIQTQSTESLSFSQADVTHVILTHLHFDHAGGVTYFNDAKEAVLTYHEAIHYLQSKNWEIANDPSVREKASYLPENVWPLQKGNLQLLDGDTEISPGIHVHCINGHTEGQQWVRVTDAGKTLVFPSDLIPTSRHLPLPFIMGYDLCPRTVLDEKARFLQQAVDEEWIVVFQHDLDVVAATITTNERGHHCVKEILE